VLIAPALPLALIHPTAWKGNSANFALTEFSEVSWQAIYHEKVIRRLRIHAGFIAFIYARGAMATEGRAKS
jgi:hypothetical protein